METIATSHGLARVEGSELAVLDLPYADVGELLRDTGSLSLVDSATVTRRLPLSRVSEVVRPPLAARRTTVWGVGLNYRAKAALRGRAVPDFPILFIKPPSSLAGPVDPISVPRGCPPRSTTRPSSASSSAGPCTGSAQRPPGTTSRAS